MQELIKITNKGGKDTVNARELHEFLESRQDFSTWIKNRIEKYDFVENIDFVTAPQNYGTANGGHSTRNEYYLSIDMAKELSMVENNEKGKIARQYFIECEKRLNQPLSLEEMTLKVIEGQKQRIAEMQKIIEIQKPKVETYEKLIDSSGSFELRIAAKILSIQPQTLNKLLIENGIINKNRIAYQKYVDIGVCVVKPVTIPNGQTISVTYITPKGLDYIAKKLNNKEV